LISQGYALVTLLDAGFAGPTWFDYERARHVNGRLNGARAAEKPS
jgi:hypothetical protein